MEFALSINISVLAEEGLEDIVQSNTNFPSSKEVASGWNNKKWLGGTLDYGSSLAPNPSFIGSGLSSGSVGNNQVSVGDHKTSSGKFFFLKDGNVMNLSVTDTDFGNLLGEFCFY